MMHWTWFAEQIKCREKHLQSAFIFSVSYQYDSIPVPLSLPCMSLPVHPKLLIASWMLNIISRSWLSIGLTSFSPEETKTSLSESPADGPLKTSYHCETGLVATDESAAYALGRSYCHSGKEKRKCLVRSTWKVCEWVSLSECKWETKIYSYT